MISRAVRKRTWNFGVSHCIPETWGGRNSSQTHFQENILKPEFLNVDEFSAERRK
jgi:hypothetical protein